MESLITTLEYILGLSGETLVWWQLALRAVLLYAAGLTLVRIGKRRFMGTYTAFDMILGITVGALLANAASEPAGVTTARGKRSMSICIAAGAPSRDEKSPLRRSS